MLIMLGGRSIITFDFELNAFLKFCLKEVVNKHISLEFYTYDLYPWKVLPRGITKSRYKNYKNTFQKIGKLLTELTVLNRYS